MSPLTGVRARLEPVCRPDETEIEKHTFRVFSRARVGPRVLFGERTGRIDAKPNASAGGEIERGDLYCSTKVEPYGNVEIYSGVEP